MKEQLISFKTAKLAREKKCDIYSEEYYYNETKELGVELHAVCNSSAITKTYPQSLLQKWIKDVHKIHVQPIFQGWADSHYSYHCKVHFIEDGIWEYFIATKGKNNLAYEEALEIGLQEALKLIEL